MMLPQVAGMLLTSIVGGRIASRMGRNRGLMLAGVGLEAAALASLAVLAFLGAPASVFLIAMATLGLGMGMGMPNVTTAAQNAVAHRELGAATGAMTFVRSLGGALGVATSGTIMSSRLTAALAGLGGTVDLKALTEHGARALAGMTPAGLAAVSDAYRVALTGSFMLSGGVMIGAFLLILGLPELVLRDTVEEPA
jgi:MFS family permease